MTQQIHGLTKAQRKLMDKLWALKTMEEFEAYRAAQPPRTQNAIDTLVLLVTLTGIDEVIDETNSYPDTQKLFKKLGIKA